MTEQKISVIVPIYNVEDYLERCIESICRQTYRNLEIILVDDGSTDSSGAICERYAAHDRRIRVIHQKNGGLVSARKLGLKASAGDYIGFVDGDDYLEPEMYAALLGIMCRENVDFVHSGYYVNENPGIYGTGKSTAIQIEDDSRKKDVWEYILSPASARRISPSIWSKLYRRELILEAYYGVPDENSYGEDLLNLCNCVLKASSFYITDRAYYHYVIRPDSMVHKKSVQNIQREKVLYDALCDLFRRYGLLGELSNDLETFYLYSITACIKHLGNTTCQLYKYPDIQELIGKKIILYGAGEVGQDYYTQLRRDMRCELIAVTDTRHENYHLAYMNVISPAEIARYPYDAVVVAVFYEGSAGEIKRALLKQGIPAEKILWKKPDLAI